MILDLKGLVKLTFDTCIGEDKKNSDIYYIYCLAPSYTLLFKKVSLLAPLYHFNFYSYYNQ